MSGEDKKQLWLLAQNRDFEPVRLIWGLASFREGTEWWGCNHPPQCESLQAHFVHFNNAVHLVFILKLFKFHLLWKQNKCTLLYAIFDVFSVRIVCLFGRLPLGGLQLIQSKTHTSSTTSAEKLVKFHFAVLELDMYSSSWRVLWSDRKNKTSCNRWSYFCSALIGIKSIILASWELQTTRGFWICWWGSRLQQIPRNSLVLV